MTDKESFEPNTSPAPQPTSQSLTEQSTDTPSTPPPSSDPNLNPVVPAKKSRSNKPLAIGIFIVIGILGLLGLGAGAGMWFQNNFNSSTTTTSLTSGVDGNSTVTKEESSIASVAEKVSKSVVSITGTTQTQYYYRTATGESAGTGIIVSKDGYVMTNNHVIENARNIAIVDSNGNKFTKITVIGRDPLNDIAFLKIDSDTEFIPAELGNSSTIRIGQQVVAIGNALGQYSNTVTSGIISGTGRPVTASTNDGATETLTDLIQTDASINPGNSGGALVNMAGQVIGINTAIAQDANGIGFAIPINATKGVLSGVLENGKVSRAYFGVNFLSITPDIAEQFNLSVKEGAYVYASGTANPVASGSPADKAGIQKGDIITKINGTVLGKTGGLSSVIGEFTPGQKVTVTYLRDGQTRTADVTFTAYSN